MRGPSNMRQGLRRARAPVTKASKILGAAPILARLATWTLQDASNGRSGSDIDSARTEAGETYKALANAFRFQREIVPQCTCNASASTGLSPIAIEDDMTLRTGDIVAADDGYKIAAISGGQRRSVLFRPLSKAKAQALGLARLSAR